MSSNSTPHAAMNSLEHPAIDRDTLVRGTNGMRDFFRYQEVGPPMPIIIPDLDVMVSEIQLGLAPLGTVHSGGPVDRAIVVHYGLDATNKFEIALEFVALAVEKTLRPYVYSVADSAGFSRLKDGRLSAVDGGKEAWYATGGSGHNYATKLRVERSTGSGWSPFLPHHDVTASFCPFEWHLEQLIAHNALGPADRLRILPIAAPTDWQFDRNNALLEHDRRQSCAWVAVDHWPNNTPAPPDGAYTAKAADLVSPCPPNIAYVSFRSSGLARRP